MGRISFSFAVMITLVGMFIGAVIGSLVEHVFGFGLLNASVTQGPLQIAREFYLIERLDLRVTPGALLGGVAALAMLFAKRKA